jgi:hypothetical protein
MKSPFATVPREFAVVVGDGNAVVPTRALPIEERL